MLSIDGLATGIDTASIVDSLLSIQQTQIDRFNVRKQGIVDQQTAFKGLEAKLLALQGSLSQLTRISDNAFEQKTITTNDETAVKAAVSDTASEGIYRVRVESLARSHQVVSNGYAQSDSEIAIGSFDLQVGSVNSTIVVDGTNNTLDGVLQSINNSDFGVTASIVDDGTGADSFHLMLTADESGSSNSISISFTPEGVVGEADQLAFDTENPIQAAADAAVFLGSGEGALRVVSSTNQFDNLFAGITFEALKADAEAEIELNVVRDVEAAETAVQGFVDSYNDVTSYIQEQARFDPETETASVLFGNRSVSNIQNDLSQAVTSVVPGLDQAINRLTAIGVNISADGKLSVDSGELSDVLNGQVEDVSLDDVFALFSTRGSSSDQNIQFVLASDKTRASQVRTEDGQSSVEPYQVKILQAAEKAQVRGGLLSEPIAIDENNNKFSIVIDNGKTATVTLSDGLYSANDLSDHLQQLLTDHKDLKNRPVTVAISEGALSLTSLSYGRSSEITIQESSSLATLGFGGADVDLSDRGLDVVGQFIVDGVVESAEGRGQTLIGRAKEGETEGATEGLQLRVTLTPSQVTEDIFAEITVSQGIASRLGQAIKNMTDPTGSLDRIENEFTTRIESIDLSIDRMNELFESRQQSLLAEFARLESSVSELQSVGSLLGSQLGSLPAISV